MKPCKSPSLLRWIGWSRRKSLRDCTRVRAKSFERRCGSCWSTNRPWSGCAVKPCLGLSSWRPERFSMFRGKSSSITCAAANSLERSGTGFPGSPISIWKRSILIRPQSGGRSRRSGTSASSGMPLTRWPNRLSDGGFKTICILVAASASSVGTPSSTASTGEGWRSPAFCMGQWICPATSLPTSWAGFEPPRLAAGVASPPRQSRTPRSALLLRCFRTLA